VKGRYEYAGGLALLVASAVNLHHFILDGAIWKLRNTRIASVLIRAESEPAEGLPEPVQPATSWLRPAVWAAASIGLAVGLGVLWLEDFALRAAFLRNDPAGLNRVLDRMAWLGRDNTPTRLLAGRMAAKAGDWEASLAANQAALAMSPDESALQERIAALTRRLRNPERAVAHLRDALRLAPAAQELRNELAWTLATSGDPRIRAPEEAVRVAEALVHETEKPDPNWLDTLAAGYAAGGRFEDAIRVATQAEALAQSQGKREMGEQIGARLALYRERKIFVETEVPRGG
jgi:tetratricopeptide (TPR) repeat protein